MTINENKMLSRNRKRRNERRNRMNDENFFFKIKLKQKKIYKNVEKIEKSGIQLVRMKYADKPDKLESPLRELNKVEVFRKKLHEIKQKILSYYVGAFEMVGNIKVGDQMRPTNNRFRNFDDFESYINSIDEEYDAEDAIFNGYIYKIKTPQFNKLKKSQYGIGCDLKHEIFEYRRNNFYIPNKGYCYVKCINYITDQDCKQQYVDFIRNEKRRSKIMTKARIQPFCRANNNNLGYFDGKIIFLDRLQKKIMLCFYTIINFV